MTQQRARVCSRGSVGAAIGQQEDAVDTTTTTTTRLTRTPSQRLGQPPEVIGDSQWISHGLCQCDCNPEKCNAGHRQRVTTQGVHSMSQRPENTQRRCAT